MHNPIRLWRKPDAIDWEGPGRYGPTVECDQHGTYVVHSRDVRGSLAKYWGPRELVDFLGADRVVGALCAACEALNSGGDTEAMDNLSAALITLL